jgi:TolB-like protein
VPSSSAPISREYPATSAARIAARRRVCERSTGVGADSRIELRIGINLGDVIVEGDDLYGDGVNIAARIEALADAGGVFVSSTVHDQVRDRLPFAFEDLGEQQVKNIARPVRVYRVRDVAATAKTPALPVLALPDKPSLAVLPFQNMTGDAEQDYFVDGIVEEITTAISRLPWLFVIARNSSFAYKGKAVDVKQVTRELGVRYVLEGSVRKAGNRVRITGQLIDTATGAHIWADRFDGAFDDIFELQDQVASSVIGAIEPRLFLSEMEHATRKPTENLDAYDLYLRARAQYHKLTDEGMREAVASLRRALTIDPSYAPAAAMIGVCRITQMSSFGWVVSDAERTEAAQLAAQSIEMGKDDPDALWMGALAFSYFSGAHGTAASALDRALALNPNSAYAWTASGWVSCHRNRPEQAIDAFHRAMRLSPLDPLGWAFKGGLALAHLVAGRYEEAVDWAEGSSHEQPRSAFALRVKVVACVHLGRIEEGRELLQQLLRLQPGLTIAGLKAYRMSMFAEAFRIVGLPEE